MRDKPVRNAATKIEMLADKLMSKGLAVSVDILGVKNALQFRVEIPKKAR